MEWHALELILIIKPGLSFTSECPRKGLRSLSGRGLRRESHSQGRFTVQLLQQAPGRIPPGYEIAPLPTEK